MDDFWGRYHDDPGALDDIYEREFGDDLNPLNQEFDDDDDENDPFYQIHNYNHVSRSPQTQSQSSNSLATSQTNLCSQSHIQPTTIIQNTDTNTNINYIDNSQQNEENGFKHKNFKNTKSNSSLQQMDMVNRIITCFASLALIFGIISIISLSSDEVFSFIYRLIVISEKWNSCLLYIWLNNINMRIDLVIFVFFVLCFFLFCFYFYFFRFSICTFCWANPMTTCFITRVATGIGIGLFVFFIIQHIDIAYQYRLRLDLKFCTNTWLECLYELFICFMCFACEKFCFSLCFYFKKLCNSIFVGKTRWRSGKIFERGIKDR